MATITRRLSLEEFVAIPDFDERRLELIDGEVFEEMSPNWIHTKVAGVLISILMQYGISGPEPRTMIPASGTRAPSSLLPDVVFFRADPETDDWLRSPPDIAIEILSPGQPRRDLRIKADTYLGFGVPTVWVIDPERLSIDIYDEGVRIEARGTDKLRASMLPELDLSVDQLFDRAQNPGRR